MEECTRSDMRLSLSAALVTDISRRVHSVAGNTCCFVMSVRPSAFISATPSGRILMKFYVGDYCENLSGQ